MGEINLETFGEIMNDFIEEHEIKALLTMPAGTQKCTMQSNVGIATVDCFILLAAIPQLIRTIEGANEGLLDIPKLAKGIGRLVEEGILEEFGLLPEEVPGDA